MNTVLITGGAGFIGANFCHYWVKNHPSDNVVVLDALTYAGDQTRLADLEQRDNFTFVHGDICDEILVDKLFREYQFNTVVHFAAESHVDRSIDGPDAFIQANVIGTHTLLKLAKQYWLDSDKQTDNHRFHHVSTDEVYGSLDVGDPAFTENTPYAPNSPYSASKASSDHFVRAYHHTYGLNTSISNCSNNYGPYQDTEKLIPLIISNILNGQALPIYGDGSNIRDWLYVDDHCRGIELILNSGQVGENYNIGGENEWKNIDIVRLVCELVDKKLLESPGLLIAYPNTPIAKGKASQELITYVKDRLGHDKRYAIDPSKCHSELDYHPEYTFEQGIDRTVDWYLTKT